jgi:hypothetical protein
VSAVGLLLLSPSFLAFSDPFFLLLWLAFGFSSSCLLGLLALLLWLLFLLGFGLLFDLALPKPAARRQEALRAVNGD